MQANLIKARASLPARGARIEMDVEAALKVAVKSLPARGARIEMAKRPFGRAHTPRRSPQGERGLKSRGSSRYFKVGNVAPRKGSAD